MESKLVLGFGGSSPKVKLTWKGKSDKKIRDSAPYVHMTTQWHVNTSFTVCIQGAYACFIHNLVQFLQYVI
jgi:hypothetical protein